MLAGATVLVAVTAAGGVVAMSSAKQATPAAQRAPTNTATVDEGNLSAVVFEVWDADLWGAIGRLAVRGDQPGPRDLHQAAR